MSHLKQTLLLPGHEDSLHVFFQMSLLSFTLGSAILLELIFLHIMCEIDQYFLYEYLIVPTLFIEKTISTFPPYTAVSPLPESR